MKTRDWLTGYDVKGRVLLAGRSVDALKAEKLGPVHSVDEIPGRSEVGSSSQPAVHSNQFPGHASVMGISFHSQISKLRRLKISCRDVSMVIVAGRL